jgi:hypothetical protein
VRLPHPVDGHNGRPGRDDLAGVRSQGLDADGVGRVPLPVEVGRHPAAAIERAVQGALGAVAEDGNVRVCAHEIGIPRDDGLSIGLERQPVSVVG